jgi:hypothetical protein
MADEMPCPWCGAMNATHDFAAATRTWSSEERVARYSSKASQQGTCAACGRSIQRDAMRGQPWRRVFAEGDRVRGPHPRDAFSGQLHPGTVKSTRQHASPTGTIDMVMVEYDQLEMFPGGGIESAEVSADALQPLREA